MNRTYLILILLLAATMPLRADEGLWIINMLEKYNIEKMREMGCKLEMQDIYSADNPSLKDAVLQFGNFDGGFHSGTVISDNGLFITSHNAAHHFIHRLSSPENNYLNNGFWALEQNKEIPVNGLTASFVVGITDVTEEMQKANKRAEKMPLYDASEMFKYVKERLCKEVTGKDETLIANVVELQHKNVYYVVVRRIFKDVRLVAAPAVATEFYNPENDNGLWPASGGFAMFRVYADAKNNPAEYSPENKPYTPNKAVSVSLKGFKPDDFVMSIGFPQSNTGKNITIGSRTLLAENLKFTRNVINPMYIHVYGEKLKTLEELMRISPQMKLFLADEYAQTLYIWKKHLGINNSIDILNVIQNRTEQEQQFVNWVNETQERIDEYGELLPKMYEYTQAQTNSIKIDEFIELTLSSIKILQPAAPNAKLMINFEKYYSHFYDNYNVQADKELAKLMLKLYIYSKPEPYAIPSFYNIIIEKFNNNIDAYVEYVYTNSVFTNKESFFEAIGSKRDLSNDPARVMQQSIFKTVKDFRHDWVYYKEDLDPLWNKYSKAMLEMNASKPFYPQATNHTPVTRLTYGNVTPYPAENNNPLSNCSSANIFLSNCDIVDGSYGSGILNANGELLGIAFGETIDAMCGEYYFDKDYQRCASTDIRYIMEIIKSNNPNLLKEINIVE